MAPNDLSSPSAVDHVSFSFDDDSHPHLLSSPPRPLAGGGKERRQPSITPRKFRRFFTPRSRVPAHPSAARAALRDLTARALNGAAFSSSSPPPHLGYGSSPTHTLDGNGGQEGSYHHGLPSPRSAKRRRTNHFTPDTSPLKPYSLGLSAGAIHRGGRAARTPEAEDKTGRVHAMLLSPSASSPPQLPALDDFSDGDDLAMSDAGTDPETELGLDSPTFSANFTSLAQHGGLAGRLLQRQLGTMPGPGNHTLDRPVADWRADTADFYSSPNDIHLCSSHENENERCIPFCAAACNTNGLIAVGDEEGRIRLLDADGPGRDDFSKTYLSFPAHGNAIIDLAFSSDDRLLATASGDQTGKVFDMMSQTPISILDHHTASLKQVRFQPGRSDGNVLATSGRDGCIKIWDLRCKGGPAQEITAIEWTTGLQYGPPRKVNQGCVVNSIFDAHARVPLRPTRQTRQQQVAQQAAAAAAAAAAVTANAGPRWDVPGRAGEVSVTAIQFLPPGREHLLFSACEADASVKVWDIRNVNPTSRTGRGASSSAAPVAVTAPPESHSQWRPFGLSSLSLSTDGARLYGLCKDNTVYAYSTAHLVIGSAPEPWSKEGQLQQLQQNYQQQPPPPPRRRHGVVQEGPGPLFGLRHENFHATSFYVKTAVRPAQNGQSELLAVGSSDGCAVLFPTDEQCILDAIRNEDPAAAAATTTMMMPSRGASGGAPRGARPGLFRTNSMSSNSNTGGRLVDTIPVARSGFGTALVRGHEKKEVGAVCWTHAGRLVTVGDDFMVRRWHEDRAAAATLRTGGEAGGQRWMSGWADVGEDWDAVDAAEEEAFF